MPKCSVSSCDLRFRTVTTTGGQGYSRTKNQPKEEVFGTDIPRTSGGHSRGYPGPKLRSGRSKSWKNKHFGADIHDPKARTSTTLRDFQKLRSEKLWAEFSFPIYEENLFSERVTQKTRGKSQKGTSQGINLPELDDAQNRRKRTSTHEWPHAFSRGKGYQKWVPSL